MAAYNLLLFLGVKFYYVYKNKYVSSYFMCCNADEKRNRTRDNIWNAMTEQERQTYLATTTDKGNKR